MPDKQTQYAIDQYNLCCRYLGISPKYNDDGRTLFEEIVMMEKDIKALDNECWDYRLNNTEKIAKFEDLANKLLGQLRIICKDGFVLPHIYDTIEYAENELKKI